MLLVKKMPPELTDDMKLEAVLDSVHFWQGLALELYSALAPFAHQTMYGRADDHVVVATNVKARHFRRARRVYNHSRKVWQRREPRHEGQI